MTALGSKPGSVICLGPQTYTESFVLYASDLTLIGTSASETSISVTPSWVVRGHVAFKGVSFTHPVYADGFDSVIDFAASRFEQPLHIQRYSFTGDGAGVDVHVDGCELLQGLFVHDTDPQLYGDYQIDIENSYIHGATGSGVRVLLHHSYADIDLRLANNTIVGCDKAVDVAVTTIANATTQLTASLFNNIAAGSTSVGIAIDDSGAVSGSTVATGNNAVYDNGVNYSGTASDGPGYVKQSCLLDAATPPGLQAGSPCLGAADPAQAPSDDFWGTPRPPAPDIGAIEMP